jgi:hypothetical protein
MQGLLLSRARGTLPMLSRCPIILQILFCFFPWLIIFLQGLLIFLNGLGHLPEEEWNLTGSLPLHPVLEYGIDVLLAKMIVLLESYLLWQILSLDILVLGLLQFCLGDLSLSRTNGGV